MSYYDEHGLAIRVAYLAVAGLCRLVDGMTRLRPRPPQAVVLCYHGVTAAQRERFAWQMRQLAGRAVDLADGEHQARCDRRRPGVCVTFDDAFANLLDNALPTLRQLNIPAIIFAVPASLGTRPAWEIPPEHPEAAEPVMTPEQLAAARDVASCRIGSHTMTHIAIGRSRPEVVQWECEQSKAHLEKLLGAPVDDLALPYGSYNDRAMQIARAAGYRRIYTLDPCLHPLGQDGPVGRFSMTPDAWRIEFRLTCAGAYRWLLPWRRFLRRIRPQQQSATSTEPSLA